MVLTDRQRADLHAGIYEYLCSQSGEGFSTAAEALKTAVPADCERHAGLRPGSSNGHIPVLEKKWTAIPRLQKKVLELEKQAAQSAKIHAHRIAGDPSAEGASGGARRMLPRLPATHTLSGHSMVVTCCAVHPVFTVVVSGSEDGTIKVSRLLPSRGILRLQSYGRLRLFGSVILLSAQLVLMMSTNSRFGTMKAATTFAP